MSATIAPEKEPEYVGAHSARAHPECQNWTAGEDGDTPEKCGEWSTHTVVMYDGELHEIAMCSSCGEPDDVDDGEREWTGEIVGGKEVRGGGRR